MTLLLSSIVRRLRPAPLASAVADFLGLSARRLLETRDGVFWVNPVSNLGYSLIQGMYEARMEAVLHKYLFPGAVFVDVGANEGYFAVLASRLVGAGGIVVAVEPQSRLQNVIATNIGLNQCFNVRLAKAALSSKTELVSLALTPEMFSGATSLFKAARFWSKKEIVQSYTLRDFLDRCALERCDLMKVDIEGAEYDVFMEAGDVLTAGTITTIALEFHPSVLERRGLSQNDLGRFIEACGYTYLGDSVYSRRDPARASLQPE